MIASTDNSTTTKVDPLADQENHRRPNLDREIDTDLVRRFAEHDETAFVEIMTRYRGKIFSVVLGLLRNHADAEEITQDTFIRAHRGLANFRGDSALSTWLHRIAVNLSRNHYWHFFRRRRQDSCSLDGAYCEGSTATFSEMIADGGQDPAQETVINEFGALVERCMARLSERDREILQFRSVHNHSYEEIGASLAMNVGTVKSRMARARKNLRTLLAETCPEFASDATSHAEWFLPARATYGRLTIALAPDFARAPAA